MFISCQKLIKKKIIEGKKIEFLILQNLCVSVFFFSIFKHDFPLSTPELIDETDFIY